MWIILTFSESLYKKFFFSEKQIFSEFPSSKIQFELQTRAQFTEMK